MAVTVPLLLSCSLTLSSASSKLLKNYLLAVDQGNHSKTGGSKSIDEKFYFISLQDGSKHPRDSLRVRLANVKHYFCLSQVDNGCKCGISPKLKNHWAPEGGTVANPYFKSKLDPS